MTSKDLTNWINGQKDKYLENNSIEILKKEEKEDKSDEKKKIKKRRDPNEPPRYDPRNTLNDLNGREWIKFLKSWFVFDALHSDLKEEKEICRNTEQHPATFSPTMISGFINFFTKKNMKVLDPFAGIGSTLVACERTGRIGYGIELNKQFADICRMRIDEKHHIYDIDASKIKELNLPEIDFCITSPPYWSMLNKIDVNQKKRIEQGLMTNYGEFKGDLGDITNYEEFMEKLISIFYDIYDILRNKAYLVIIVQNIINGGEMIPFAWDLAIRLSKEGKYILKKEKIWCQDHKPLHPYGYPYAWVSNTFHHYCLVFRKEKIKRK